jgi:hemoglobin
MMTRTFHLRSGNISVCVSLLAILAASALAGCGAAAPQSKKAEFFTSGNREADQRADQRMVKDQQVKTDGGGSASAQKASGDAPTAKKTLYERLGAENGIKGIVEDFTARALADPRVNWRRTGVKYGGFNIHSNKSMEWDANPANVQTLKAHLVQFFSLSTGGPAQYDGRPMQAVHAGRHINNAEFDAAIGDLKASLDKLKVGDREQKELLSIIESTRPEVVEER